jgi:glycosyltransferase involved in cell wall biosynthesis
MEVFGLEACGMEDTYAWDKVNGEDSFTRITLTELQRPGRAWKLELRERLRQALAKIKPKVVVVAGWSFVDAVNALAWCSANQTPAVLMSETTAWDESRVAWKEWIKRRVIMLCSAALVGGKPHLEYLVHLGFPQNRILLGYDAVDNEYFATQSDAIRAQEMADDTAHSDQTRRKYSLPAKFFLASARFVEKKNLPRLIEAYSRYRQLVKRWTTTDHETTRSRASDKRPSPFSPLASPLSAPWSLVLLGDGPLKADICRLVSDLSIEDCVYLPGFKQYHELPIYYGLASAFVHASTVEQWGLVVNEAMASGLPVLVSNRCGCARDLVQEGVNGFAFDPYDVEELAQLMLKISAFNFPLSQFGSASRGIIADWGPDRFASGLQQAVDVALKTPRPRATLVDRLLLRLLLLRR